MKKGFVLITVLAILILIALGTAAVLQAVGSQTNLKFSNLQEVENQYLAEAGMQFALWNCRTNGCAFNAVDPALPTVAIVATNLSPAGAPPVFQIQTTVTYVNALN